MSGFYACQQPGEEGEGLSEPVRYGVWVVVGKCSSIPDMRGGETDDWFEEPFTQLEKHCPHLINVDAVGEATRNSYMTDLFDR
jgi:dual specificity MAP kinase phosphatase